MTLCLLSGFWCAIFLLSIFIHCIAFLFFGSFFLTVPLTAELSHISQSCAKADGVFCVHVDGLQSALWLLSCHRTNGDNSFNCFNEQQHYITSRWCHGENFWLWWWRWADKWRPVLSCSYTSRSANICCPDITPGTSVAVMLCYHPIHSKSLCNLSTHTMIYVPRPLFFVRNLPLFRVLRMM